MEETQIDIQAVLKAMRETIGNQAQEIAIRDFVTATN